MYRGISHISQPLTIPFNLMIWLAHLNIIGLYVGY